MEYSLTENKINKTIDLSSPINSNRAKLFLDNTIIANDPKWGEKLRNYEKLKEVFHYNPKVYPKIITTKMVTQSNRQFNPITQKYYNEEKEQKVINDTKNNRLSMISNGYDKQLEVESTYNIINLKNKLGNLYYEESPQKVNSGFAKNDNQFNYEKNNQKPYNIISNISLREHNYVSPDLRPVNDDKLIKSNEGLIFKNRNRDSLNEKMNNKYGRDFNIINNRYKVFNEEKMKTEKEIKNLIALKKIKNIKKYDIIKSEYLDSEKKDNKKTVDKNYLVRNPINNMIYDKEEQKKLDEIEFNKKKRFQASDKLDDFRHSVGYNIEGRRLQMEQNYFNPFEYKLLNKRGYDILTNEPKTLSELNKDLTEIQSNKLITNWDKIKNNADKNNNTFKSKKIYKAEYDESDIDINYSNYMKLRKPTLTQKNYTIDINTNNTGNDDKNYLLRTPISKKGRKEQRLSKSIEEILNSNGSNSKIYNKMENRINPLLAYSNMDKGLFFGTPKTVLKKKPKYKI